MVDVVNIKTCRDFGTRSGDVYIGRAWGKFQTSAWANPYHISRGLDRDAACDLYEEYIEAKLASGELNITDLIHAKRLGCWCSPERCHGDYLAKKIYDLRAEEAEKCIQMTKKSLS